MILDWLFVICVSIMFALALLWPALLDEVSGGGDVFMHFGCACDEIPCTCWEV